MRLPVRVVSTEAAVEGLAQRLTARQKQVALLLVSGKRGYERAALLGITPEEVSRLTRVRSVALGHRARSN